VGRPGSALRPETLSASVAAPRCPLVNERELAALLVRASPHVSLFDPPFRRAPARRTRVGGAKSSAPDSEAAVRRVQILGCSS